MSPYYPFVAYYLDPLIKIKYQLADLSRPFGLVFTGSDMRFWLGDLLGVGHITGCMWKAQCHRELVPPTQAMNNYELMI